MGLSALQSVGIVVGEAVWTLNETDRLDDVEFIDN